MKKENKTTLISFDEAHPYIEISTHNTALRKRLKAYHEKHPDLCQLIDEDPETCYAAFTIHKNRFSFRLTEPYADKRREQARQSILKDARPHRKLKMSAE